MEMYYLSSVYYIDQYSRKQYGESESRQRRSEPVPERPSRAARLRLWTSTGLHELATALDPAVTADRAPSHQH